MKFSANAINSSDPRDKNATIEKSHIHYLFFNFYIQPMGDWSEIKQLESNCVIGLTSIQSDNCDTHHTHTRRI